MDTGSLYCEIVNANGRGMKRYSDQVRVMGPRDNKKARPDEKVIMTCGKAGRYLGLSPFILGPCFVPGYGKAVVMENAWQFSKVYEEHADKAGNPTHRHWIWAHRGYNDPRAHRYPMGKGAVPLYSIWGGRHLSYVDARKKIYIPLYRRAVANTEAFRRLKRLYDKGREIALWDYDGYDHEAQGLSLWAVVENEKRKCGHAFVLKMMLMYGSDFGLHDVWEDCK